MVFGSTQLFTIHAQKFKVFTCWSGAEKWRHLTESSARLLIPCQIEIWKIFVHFQVTSVEIRPTPKKARTIYSTSGTMEFGLPRSLQSTIYSLKWRSYCRRVFNFQIPYWSTVPQQWLPCHSENRKVQCYRISLNYISIISLQESAEELVDWANTPLQSSNLQIFQITTGKICSSGPKICQSLWVTPGW